MMSVLARCLGGAALATSLFGCGGSNGNSPPVATSGATSASSSGSNSSSGEASSGAPMRTVGSCSSPGSPGTLENITPPQLNIASWCVPGANGCPNMTSGGKVPTYGAHFFALDPLNSGTIYLGTSSLGFWKSTDCGATWAHIDTGANGNLVDQGRNWSIAIDPTNSQIIYTCAGYGPNGLFKSTNGGVDWQQMFTADVAKSIPYGGFVEKITLDPTDHEHVLVSFHGPCTNAPNGGGNWGCLAESKDGGQSWSLTNSGQSWTEGDGQTMIDAKNWFFGNGGGGIWRTSNAGQSWTQVFTGEVSGSVLVAQDGSYYVAGQRMVHSTDGNNWTVLQNSPSGSSVNGSLPIAEVGTSIYAVGGAYGGEEPTTGWYASTTEADPTTWTPDFNVVQMVFGGSNLAYDADHHFLYSSNLTAGFWRVSVQ